MDGGVIDSNGVFHSTGDGTYYIDDDGVRHDRPDGFSDDFTYKRNAWIGKLEGLNPDKPLNEVAGEQQAADESEIAQGRGGVTGFTDLFGGNAAKLDSSAPGATVDTTQSDSDHALLSPMSQQLREQAQTGDGSWQQMLARGTQAANASATALGQSVPGVGYGQALRTIANNTAANNQRAIGQGNILRAQQRQAAATQLGATLGGQSAIEASQAASKAGAAQGVTELNDSIDKKTGQDNANLAAGGAQALGTVAALLSDGGAVPGQPKVFGDDEKNDTVPAWLSPGEVVLPRHITKSPDAPERAADFVRAVQARHRGRAHQFADGGDVPPAPALPRNTKPATGEDADPLPPPAPMDDTSVKPASSTLFGGVFGGANQHPAGIENGGLLDTANYDFNRDATLSNAQNFLAQANGGGQEIPTQHLQDSTDSNIANAMQSMANARGPGAAAAGANAVAMASQGMQGAAGKAANVAQEEQQRGQKAFADAVQAQRARDLALAQTKQQFAWRNSLMNSGIDMQQQALFKSLLGGAGQGLAGLSGLMTRSPSIEAPDSTPDENPDGANWDYPGAADDWNSPDTSNAGDFSTPDVSGGANAAHGGEVVDSRAKDFVAALKRRAA